MKNFLLKLGLKLQRFMIGRYGIDNLWRVLLVFYLISVVVTNIVYRYSRIAYYSLSVASLTIIAFAIFRVFSKNIEARRNENAKWLKFSQAIKQKFIQRKNINKQRKTHKFVKCKQCKKTLRLPKNKGRVNVRCPHCDNQFIVNTGKKTK